MKRLIAFLILCACISLPARAAGFDQQSASFWASHYYMDNDTGRVGEFVQWVAAHDFKKSPNTGPPMTGFLAAVFGENPTLVRGWVKDVKPASDESLGVIQRALWLSGHAYLIGEVFDDKPGYEASPAPGLMDIPLNNPGSWDVMYAAFYATGNTDYPARLADLLDDGVKIVPDDALNAVYHRTVAWSLASNMRQHELILRRVKREVQARTGAVQVKLKEMLAQLAADRLITPHCDGEFCAVLAVVSEANLKELDKPSDQTPVLNHLAKAKTDDRVAVVVTFTGMSLAEDLSADVRYDIKVTQPDGRVYSGADFHDAEIVKHKLPERLSIFDNRSRLLMIHFEAKDPRGAYRVETVVKDKIGGKTVRMTREIVLE